MCEDCLKDMLNRIEEADAIIMGALRGSSLLNGVTAKELSEDTDFKNTKITRKMEKMYFAGLIDYYMDDKSYRFYLTEAGKVFVDLLNNI